MNRRPVDLKQIQEKEAKIAEKPGKNKEISDKGQD